MEMMWQGQIDPNVDVYHEVMKFWLKNLQKNMALSEKLTAHPAVGYFYAFFGCTRLKWAPVHACRGGQCGESIPAEFRVNIILGG